VSILHSIVHLLFGIAGLAMARTAAQARHYLVFGGAIYLVLFLYGLIVGQESGQLRAREYCRRRPASHTRDRDGRARSRAHAGSYGGRRRHQLRTPVDVTTSIARKTTPPTTRRFDPGRHRLVRDRGGHRNTFGTLRLSWQAGKDGCRRGRSPATSPIQTSRRSQRSCGQGQERDTRRT
jgi:hypothetical protein